MSKYGALVIDPPWRYGNAATRGAAEDHYPTMSIPGVPPEMVGTKWRVNDWRIHLDQGHKEPRGLDAQAERALQDIRIWVATPGGDYSLMSLASLGVIVGLWYRNENLLYPPSSGYKGGELVLEFLEDSCREGGIRAACKKHGLKPPTIHHITETPLGEEAA